ncbi:MAG: hypothetical protein ACE5FL_11825 [Myxococcota bacterium]
MLQGDGYETYCFTSNAWISDGLGLTRGFDWQDESLRNQGRLGLGFSFVHRLLDRIGLQEADKGGGRVAAGFEAWAAERPADAQRPADLARMTDRLQRVQDDLQLPALDVPLAVGDDAPELDAATQEQLRALGYVP